jgi:hypothetical protein
MAVVRELLATLGINVDAPSFKRADKALANLAAQAEQHGKRAGRGGAAAFGGGGEGFGAKVASLRNAATVVADVGVKIGYALANAVAQVAELGSRLNRTAGGFRINATELQGWEHAVGRVGVGADEFTGTLSQLESKAFSAAFRGDAGAVMAFSRLGVSIRGSNGQLKTGLELFEDAVAKLDKMKPGVEKTQKAIELLGENLGRQAAQDGFADKVRQWRKDVEDFGAALDEQTRGAIKRYGEEQSKVGLVLKNLRQGAEAPLFDVLSRTGNRITEFIRTQKGAGGDILGKSVAQLAKLEEPISKIGIALYRALPFVGLVVELLGSVATVLAEIASFVYDKVIPAFDGMGKILVPVGLAVLAAFFPLHALIAGIILLVEDFIGYQKGHASLIGTAMYAFRKWREEFQKKGNTPWWFSMLEAAHDLVANKLPAAWEKLRTVMEKVITGWEKVIKFVEGREEKENEPKKPSKLSRFFNFAGAASGVPGLVVQGGRAIAKRLAKPSEPGDESGVPVFSPGAFGPSGLDVNESVPTATPLEPNVPVPTVAVASGKPGRVVNATFSPIVTINAEGFLKEGVERAKQIAHECFAEDFQTVCRALEQ